MATAEPKSRRCAEASAEYANEYAARECIETEPTTEAGTQERNRASISERVSAAGGSEQAKMADGISRLRRETDARRETEVLVEAEVEWSENVFKNMTNTNCASAAVGYRRSNDIFLLLRISGTCGFVNLFLAVYFVFSFIVSCQCVPQFSGSYQEQRFAMEPQDQRAIVNSRVTLPCRVVGKSGVLQWTKDDFGLGTHRNLSGYDRYSMIGSDEEGDYSLDIASLTLDDDGKYQCQVSSGPQGQPGIRSRYATLTVLVPPEPPKILQGAYLSTTEDREIELECVSVGGKPAAEITWIDGNGGVLSHGLKYTVEPLSDGRRFTARSILRMVPRRHHHNQTFICQAQNTADRAYRAAKITLEVKYAPKVEVSVVSGAVGGRIPEGAEVRIGCKADANPNDLLYKWYLNDQPVVGDYTTEMVIFNITRKYHDAIVKCEVHNAVGKSEETETLDVSFGPKFKRRPTSVEAESGSAAVLACDVDGNPPPEVTWLHHEQDRKLVVGRAPNLTLTVDTSSEGRYYCKASVPGFPDIEAEASVYLKGPPTITSHRTQFGIQGDNVRVECTAYSVPRPDHVAWTFNGREIHTGNDQDYSFLEDPLPDGVKSTLIIRESQSKHFGVYNCSVSNEYGIDMADIMLKPQKSFPLLLILFGVTSGIIVIAAFVMLVILCQRKRRKREASSAVGKKPDVMADLGNAGTGDRHCKESDRNSNISDLKLELRQSDGGCELDYSSQDYSCNGSENALHHSNIHLTSNLGLGLPLAGPVTLPSTDHANALIMQYTRYSNDYTDPTFTANHYKDGHNNNGYVPYVDYSRDYNPPILHLQSPPHAAHDAQTANRIQLTSLHSNNQLNQLNNQLSALNSNNGSLNGSLTRSIDTASTVQFNSGNASQNNSLQRSIVNKHQDNSSALNSLGLPTVGNDGNHALYATQQHNGVLKTGIAMHNGSVVGPNGIDVRYAATYGNPYLRTTSGLGGVTQVNTANPAATPAPPPYSSIRNSVVGLSNMPSGTITSPTSLSSSSASHAYSISPGVTTSVTTSVGNAQPQVARSVTLLTPQSPSSQYILPPSSQASGQMVQLTKKGNGNQTSLATHV